MSGEDVIEGIKKLFPHKRVKITIAEKMDETDYILSKPELAAELLEPYTIEANRASFQKSFG